eukprot:7220950-Prymnesium_polylepis.1
MSRDCAITPMCLLLRCTCKSSYHVDIAAKLATHEPAWSVRATLCSGGAWRSSTMSQRGTHGVCGISLGQDGGGALSAP